MNVEIQKAMINLQNEIKELLQLHNCVVIPEFGGFVARYEPAFHNLQKQLMGPPAKVVAFNAGLKHNDGLLINFISSKYTIPYQKAEELTASISKSWKNIIEDESILKLEGIGTLIKNEGGQFTFEPQLQENLLTDSFGLGQVKALPVQRHERKKAAAVKVSVPTKIKPVRKYSSVGIAAMILGILLLINAGLFLSSNNRFQENLSTISPVVTEGFNSAGNFIRSYFTVKEEIDFAFLDATEEEEYFEEYVDLTIYSDLVETELEMNPSFESENPVLAPSEELKPLTETKVAAVPKPQKQKGNNYYIIVGSFRAYESTEEILTNLSKMGYTPELLSTDFGNVRVAVIRLNSETEALRKLDNIKNTINKSAWILNE